MEKDGGWVFISHSHLDIETVRKIRNRLEEKGFEPLMFYLKCLNDDDEIENLIKREIDAREWFIYVESENSLKAKWVKSERDYIATLKGKKVFCIDMKKDVLEQVDKITKQLKIFISCSCKDMAICETIKQALLSKDFLALNDEKAAVGADLEDSFKQMLDISAREGFVLLIVTENSSDSEYLRLEIEYTRKAGGKIIPVYVGDATLDNIWDDYIREIAGIHMDKEPTDEQLEKLISHINHQIKFYNSDFTVSQGFRGARSIQYPCVSAIPAYTFWDCDNLETVYIPPSVSYISEQAFRKNQRVVIVCDKGSYAQQYCIDNNIEYILDD